MRGTLGWDFWSENSNCQKIRDISEETVDQI
jgi:hypothetical protein